MQHNTESNCSHNGNLASINRLILIATHTIDVHSINSIDLFPSDETGGNRE
uniref:Uncharacterized protein n=1 Tax=Rhizophora mucronata TaxID=61149 RepID=A0A2P2KAV7_RHIMU